MPAETPWDTRLGCVLEGAYRITRVIGEGGMGAVYEAIQLRLNKRVAIKLMARQLTANQDALARFRREAAITSRLGHPNLVNVIDFGASQAGEPYLVMEYLDGEDLDQRLRRRGTVPIELAVHIAKQTASALGAAHAQGIVHRDLKPANIFLVNVPGELEFVKVLDFGISKVKAAESKLTKPAVALGTPFYMSPEQAAGMTDAIDHPADQWALACITWEMLCGHTPFVADDVTALFFQVINLKPQSLLLSVPGLAPEAELVLLRALSKSPKDRYPSIRDFAHAFEAAATGRPVDLTPLPVALTQLSTLSASPAVEPDLSAGTAPQGKEHRPKQATTFSRATGEITDRISKKNWFGLKPVHALAVLASTLTLIGAILLLRPRPPSTIRTTVPAVLPSVAALPLTSPLPDSVPSPPPNPAEKATDPPARLATGRSKSKKLQLGEAKDPFESRASLGQQKKAKGISPPPSFFHRNAEGQMANPMEQKGKRTIIKEL